MFYLQISSQLAKELYLPILSQKWKKESSKLYVYMYSLHYKYLMLPCNITCVRITYNFFNF